jgi:hypothetical protein
MHVGRLIGLLAGGSLVLSVFAGSAQAKTGALTIDLWSTRADLVSGGEALTSVTLPANTSPSSVTVTLNGTDITSEFALRPNGLFEGVVTGLVPGSNTLKATAPGAQGSTIKIINHQQSGPVVSGPQAQPWTCNSGATDAGCDMPPTYTY